MKSSLLASSGFATGIQHNLYMWVKPREVASDSVGTWRIAILRFLTGAMGRVISLQSSCLVSEQLIVHFTSSRVPTLSSFGFIMRLALEIKKTRSSP